MVNAFKQPPNMFLVVEWTVRLKHGTINCSIHWLKKKKILHVYKHEGFNIALLQAEHLRNVNICLHLDIEQVCIFCGTNEINKTRSLREVKSFESVANCFLSWNKDSNERIRIYSPQIVPNFRNLVSKTS